MPDLFFKEESIANTEYPIKLHIAEPGGEYPDYYPLHCHEHMELIYFPNGKTKVVIENDTFECNAGDMVAINGHELHSSERIDNSTIFCIRIAPSFFSDIDYKNIFFKPFAKHDVFIRDCFEKIFCEFKTPGPGSDSQIKGLTYLLITHLLRNYRLTDEIALSKKKKLYKINTILQYILANYHKKLTTAELAKRFYLSEYYFCRFFKSETGMSPTNYLNKVRIEKAAVFLKNSDRSITETALEVGFEDSNYFSKLFKKYMNVTPREYKKKL